MLVMTSNGLSSDKLLNAVRNRIKKSNSAVIITTASVGYKQNDKHIKRLTSELRSCGLSVNYFDFDTEDKNKLNEYDVIELIGGNPFYLLKVMKDRACKELFAKLIKDKTVIGISAGALVFQKSINLIAMYTPQLNDEVKLDDLSGLGLTDVEILPHYHRFLNVFELFEETAKAYENTTGVKVIRLDDGEGVLINGCGYIKV